MDENTMSQLNKVTKEIFEKIDADGGGSVNQKEFKEYLINYIDKQDEETPMTP